MLPFTWCTHADGSEIPPCAALSRSPDDRRSPAESSCASGSSGSSGSESIVGSPRALASASDGGWMRRAATKYESVDWLIGIGRRAAEDAEDDETTFS